MPFSLWYVVGIFFLNTTSIQPMIFWYYYLFSISAHYTMWKCAPHANHTNFTSFIKWNPLNFLSIGKTWTNAIRNLYKCNCTSNNCFSSVLRTVGCMFWTNIFYCNSIFMDTNFVSFFFLKSVYSICRRFPIHIAIVNVLRQNEPTEREKKIAEANLF